MNSRICLLFCFGVWLAPTVFAAEEPAAVFSDKQTLLLPKNYREWIFVGSSLGLQYEQGDGKTARRDLQYKNVYLDRAAYRAFAKTQQFPEGAILVLEIANSATKEEPALQGSFQKEFVGLIAAVKDTNRFKEGWAYFRFTDAGGKLSASAKPFPKDSCFNCHQQHGQIDNVFVQFYPVLRDLASGKK